MRYLWLLLPVILWTACGTDSEKTVSTPYSRVQGKTMGTTYSIIHEPSDALVSAEVYSLLQEVNMAVSTYIPESVISRFNREGKIVTSDPHFIVNTVLSSEVFELTDGAFDPTVGPLVNAWGFGWEGRKPEAPGEDKIDSLLLLVGFDKLQIEGTDSISIDAPAGMQLDYSAVAKGYGVDAIGRYLESVGITQYFVEIGGEARVKGNSERKSPWRVGINTPLEGGGIGDLFARIALTDMSMATSGNYRNFYSVNGRKVWHTINPGTGQPEANPVVSATVLHPDCAMADALATACMVRGVESLEMIERVEDAELYLITVDDNGELQGQFTPGFEKYLLDQ